MGYQQQKHCMKFFQSLLLLLLLAASDFLLAAEQYNLEFGSRRQTTELRLSIGKSQIISSRLALDQVVIGSPEIADIKLLSSRQVLILGIKPGHTNLVFRDKNRSLIAVMDVVVGYDLNQIKRKIYEVMPSEDLIEVRGSNDSVVLSGQVSSAQAIKQAVSIAGSFVPEDKVVNMMAIGGGSQVALEVRVAEVSSNSLKELGVGLFFERDGSSLTTFSSGIIPNNAPFAGIVYERGRSGSFSNIEGVLTALERDGLARILAKPNLTSLSGQEASFLAGGEIPIPVAQNSSNNLATITVDYKEFGIGLKFTPTVLSNDKISIKMNTEVSEVDDTVSINTGFGLNIPSISTRRAGTTVEMADGQSFAIAGLLQNNMSNVINEVPGLGRIPILGALFRSSEYQQEKTELVIVVTPRLVKPVRSDQLKMPTDVVIPPNWFDQYLMGNLEHFPRGSREEPGQESEEEPSYQTQTNEAGMEGSFGHQLQEGTENE